MLDYPIFEYLPQYNRKTKPYQNVGIKRQIYILTCLNLLHYVIVHVLASKFINLFVKVRWNELSRHVRCRLYLFRLVELIKEHNDVVLREAKVRSY